MATTPQANFIESPPITMGSNIADRTPDRAAKPDRGVLGTHPALLTGHRLLAAGDVFSPVHHRYAQDRAHREVVQAIKSGYYTWAKIAV